MSSSWLHVQRERRGQHVSVEALQEEPPRSRHRYEHADRQLAGRRRSAGHLALAERPARRHSRRAHVRVEVVERSLAEEDRVRERAVPRDERQRLSVRVGHRQVEIVGLDLVQVGLADHPDRVAVGLDDRRERRQWLGRVRALDAQGREQLKVLLRPRRLGIGIDDDAIWAGFGERDGLANRPVGRDRRMRVDDRRIERNIYAN